MLSDPPSQCAPFMHQKPLFFGQVFVYVFGYVFQAMSNRSIRLHRLAGSKFWTFWFGYHECLHQDFIIVYVFWFFQFGRVT